MAFWGRSKKEDESAKLRQKQIEQFETFIPTAKGNAQKTIFNVPVPTVHGQLVFQVNLETGFPERSPQLRVLQRVMHPWVDRELNILHPKLGSGWSAHYPLGQICREVVAEFSKNPPQPAQSIMPMPVQVQPPPMAVSTPSYAGPAYTPGGLPPSLPHGMGGMPPPAGSNLPMDPSVAAALAAMQGMSGTPSSAGTPAGNPSGIPTSASLGLPASAGAAHPSHGTPVAAPLSSGGSTPAKVESSRPEPIKTKVPEIPTSFPKLDSLTIAQLEELNKNPGSLQDMVDNMETVQSMASLRDSLDNDVEQIANKNLGRREDIKKAESEIAASRARLAERHSVLATLAGRQQVVQQRYSPASLIAALDVAIEQAEEASDKLKAEYQDMDADDDRDDDKAGSDDDEKEAASRGRPGKLSHSKFCTDFVKLRTLVHMRMAKKERLQEMYGKS